MAAPILHVIVQRESADCGVAALAMYLGVGYEDVLRAVTMADRNQGKKGLWTRTMQRVAARLGHTLKLRKVMDMESDYGILRLPAHVVVLRNGLVFDTNGTVWDAEAYLADQHLEMRDCDLLIEADE